MDFSFQNYSVDDHKNVRRKKREASFFDHIIVADGNKTVCTDDAGVALQSLTSCFTLDIKISTFLFNSDLISLMFSSFQGLFKLETIKLTNISSFINPQRNIR